MKECTTFVRIRRLEVISFIMEQCFLIIFFTSFLMLILPQSTLGQSSVTIREAEEVIPAHLTGPPDPNPMFYIGKSSQGAEGRIYPYPLYDNHTNKKSDKIYHLIYMVNEYIKISLLPEIGGRLFSAFDRINNYDFVYINMSLSLHSLV